MKKTIAALMLLAGGLMAAPRVTVGVRIGAPAPVVVARPVCPGPGYTWVDGYYANGAWVTGNWAPPAVVRVERPIIRERVERPVVHARGYDQHFDHARR